ncbi:MAG: helix-turn-helix transcriptional regulator, partial [Flavisolibacter sp.]|nr:helix-turn-helix transcriptional regulator [Flavisolibacter sp.]
LVFDEVKARTGYSISIGSEQASEGGRNAAIYLISFLYDVENVLDKGIEICGLRILLSVPWMQRYLQLSEKENVLERYIALKTTGIWYKSVDAELKGLLHDLLKQSQTPQLFYQNKILRIVEIFFHWLYDELRLSPGKSNINRSDIESAQKVEGILTNDVTELPPTIKELAREVAMSESKLKKIFKAVYDVPPYEYFQKKRMQKARIMLLSGNYTIKDVGYTLGYSNLSNFTLAFKKEFGKLPSEVLKEKN